MTFVSVVSVDRNLSTVHVVVANTSGHDPNARIAGKGTRKFASMMVDLSLSSFSIKSRSAVHGPKY